ncbi:hypothetical protein [Amycolatopsis minnesotensis]|uniref:Uncharacterized protein n=1 Tax=Amycolatopsis minnesotensis TaxID=337894 RepID=A0ABP5E9F6_9PSEU
MTTPHPWGPPARQAGRRSITTGSRAQGRTALSGLRTTEDFSQAGLSLPSRALILYLLVVLVDEQEKLTGAYLALLGRFSGRDGHWTHGLDLPTLRKRCGKFLGKSAERAPTWDKIEDLVRTWQAPGTAEATLADAAGVFCRVHGTTRPHSDYSGPIRVPVWADSRVVTVDMIRHALTQSRSDVPAPRGVEETPVAVPDPPAGEGGRSGGDPVARATIPAPAGPPPAECARPVPRPALAEPTELRGWRRLGEPYQAPTPPPAGPTGVPLVVTEDHVPDAGRFTGQLDVLPADEDPAKLRTVLHSTIAAFRTINYRLEQTEERYARIQEEVWEHRQQRWQRAADVRQLMNYSIVLLKRLHPNTPDEVIGELFQAETGFHVGFVMRKIDQSG